MCNCGSKGAQSYVTTPGFKWLHTRPDGTTQPYETESKAQYWLNLQGGKIEKVPA